MSTRNILTKETRSVSFKDIKILYDSYGTGDHALVFIHGWTCNRALWATQEPLYTKYRSILIDLPGHGESEAPWGVDYNHEFFARAANVVLQQEKIEHSVLIGHSLGGPLATMMLRLFPEKVSGIFYIDSFWDIPQTYLTIEERRKLGENLHDDAFFLKTIDPLFVDKNDPDGSIRKAVTDVMAGTSTHVRVSAVATDSVPHQWRYDNVTTIPAFHVVTPNFSNIDKNWVHHIPQLRVEVWEGHGHFMHMEAPERFNNTVDRFLVDNSLLQVA
ncbi:uncharacterized protein TRUGW13939_10431 [Talaromyces rugulosus]|uniref:AB hydrolase-1 domain-containing protein n=1 Tax=Talaromyces rugulosus TaxID=121627 RepID=A0A7H8RA51_TALRU|nr:uncharacterized protein TRUGW13939_10431 [Talaromyces rugulosus]QKX63262.1 hypothetical protein TRUGW13939_10431 [Talaromyces rugulosus]